jgi:hypothetical protein
MSGGEIEGAVADRIALLSAHADLYEEIWSFMEDLTKRTFADYDGKRDQPEVRNLMAKHRTALGIRDDYRGLVRGNREDVELYRQLLAERAGK